MAAAGGMRKIVHLGEILEGLWRAIPMHAWHLDGLFTCGFQDAGLGAVGFLLSSFSES